MNLTGEHGLRRARWLSLPAVGALAWAATSLRPFTTPALVVTLLTGGAVLFAGNRLRSAEPQAEAGSRTISGVRWWLILFGALAAWELAAFVQLPRSEHPTLSSLANQVFDSHLVRALAFGAWMAAGFGMARR